jgi:opacity protein-like surface antigen
LAGASGGAAATVDDEPIVFVNGSTVLASVMHAAAAAGAEHPQVLQSEHHKTVSTTIERPSSIAGDGRGGVGRGGGGSEGSRRTTSSKSASGADLLRTVCEVDSPESDALFVHKFFCTYCDRGATWKREDREQLGLEKALKLAGLSKRAAAGTSGAAPDTFRIVYPMQHTVDDAVCAK